MLSAFKNFARSILALPYDGGIFLERPSDPVERWAWCRQYKLPSVLVLYSEDSLTSEILLRTAVAMEPDLRNSATALFLSDRTPGVRDLVSKLGVAKLPAIVYCDREGIPQRTWGTTFNPLEVISCVGAAARAPATV
ncbi:MAG: hypothetical protein HY303_01290 [Candidatus Wallbacteria bacterium]|nr:hypothetical protein [Candidatus Wallbacteria bacterium]